jgi:RHS repeat-associated protein
VYVSNESDVLNYVHFDDFRVYHAKTNVVFAANYYPFGATFGEFNRSFSASQRFKYNDKEYQEETGWYDYIARQYDPILGRFTSIDPAASLMRRWSPYAYAFNNPIRFIDPDGMVPGDFLNEKGELIGNDGINDGKVYVIKTTKTEFDSGVASAGISKEQAKATEAFVSNNSGNTAAFEENNIAYTNSVEIEGSRTTRQDMQNIANHDDGTEPSNHHEYGAAISNTGQVGPLQIGDSNLPGQNLYSDVEIPTDENTRSIMHTHQSYEKVTGAPKPGEIKLSGTIETSNFAQAPSDIDISNAGNQKNYVFSMRTKMVYVYNQDGVVATIPMKRFVDPKQ